MSRGPGRVERAVADLFSRSGSFKLDRSYTVAELCGEVFGAGKPTRAQRVSVLRAAHSVLRKEEEASRRWYAAYKEARAAAVAKFGEPKGAIPDRQFNEFVNQHPAILRCARPGDWNLLSWRVTELADRIAVRAVAARVVRAAVRVRRSRDVDRGGAARHRAESGSLHPRGRHRGLPSSG